MKNHKETTLFETSESECEVCRIDNIAIRRYDYGYTVSMVGKAGQDAKNAGDEVYRSISYHPHLAAACENAALRIADRRVSEGLKTYAAELRAACADLKRAVEARV